MSELNPKSPEERIYWKARRHGWTSLEPHELDFALAKITERRQMNAIREAILERDRKKSPYR